MWAETIDDNREKEREKERRQKETERERVYIVFGCIKKTTKAFIINYHATLRPQDKEIGQL